MIGHSSRGQLREAQGMSTGGRALGLLLALVMSFVGLVAFEQAAPAQALNASDFNPEFIISDSLFYDGNSMSAAEIQTFLDGKIGTCQTDRCLNVAVVPVPSRAAEHSSKTGQLICSDFTGGNLRVSELIYRTQVACGISAKVILVTLHKEQGLITKRNPSDYDLRAAMGMGCPDTAGCDNAYAGLGVQIWSGTRQMKIYKAAAFAKQPGAQYIQYNPNAGCGGTTLNVRNYATAALYSYTPYQPNAAALANLGGLGNACSSYGNRNFWVYYNNWFGRTTDIIPSGVTVTRMGGNDRYDVAVRVSESYFSANVPSVFVASGENFPDAIGAGPAAARNGSPVLLVPKDSIPNVVAAELRRLAPAKIVVVGGPGSVSESVVNQLNGFAPTVERIGGEDRYEVSRSLALSAFSSGSSIAYLATGAGFADALSSGAAAGARNAPVILVDGALSTLDDETWSLIDSLGVTRVYLAGGPASVSEGILNSLTSRLGPSSVTRFGGSNRFVVSSLVNRDAIPTADTFFVASGFVFPDALSATSAAVSVGAPLYVSNTNCLDREFIQHMVDGGATKMVIVGGPASVTDAAAAFKNC